MSTTTTLDDALAADLRATSARFYDEPTDWLKVSAPAIILGSSSVDEDPAEGSQQTGFASRIWELDVVVRSDTPRKDINLLMDEIRESVGRTKAAGGNLNGLANVVWAALTDSDDEIRTSDDLANQRAAQTCSVEAYHHYPRNSV